MAHKEIVSVEIQANAEQAISSVRQFKKEMGGIKDTSSSVGMTQESLEQIRDTLSSITAMNFTDLLIHNFKDIADSVNAVVETTKGWGTAIGDSLGGRLTGSFLKDWKGIPRAFKDGFKEIADGAKRVKKDVGTMFEKITGGHGAAVIALTKIYVAFKAIQLAARNAIQTAHAIRQINSEAATLGMSVNAYQGWAYILQTLGEGTDDLADSIKTLSSEQAILAEGSEGNAAAFRELGMSVEDVLAMTQEELFLKTVEGLQKVEDSVKKTQLAYQIFGEDTAARLTNVLYMNNAEMRKLIENYNLLGGAASQNLVNKSSTLSYTIQNMKEAWKGLTNSLAELFMPVIAKVVGWITKLIYVINSIIKAIFGLSSTPASKGTKKLATGMGDYKKATDNATKSVQKLKREQMGFDELNKLPGQDTSSSASTADTGVNYGGGGFSEGMFELPKFEDLGLDKIKAWFDEYKFLIQDIITWGLIGVGAGMMIAGALSWNIPLMLKGAALAGMGLALGNTEGGTFSRLSQELQDILAVITAIAKGLIGILKGLLDLIWAVIKGIVEGILEAVDIIKTTIKLIIDGLANIINGVLIMVSGWIDAVVGFWTGDFEACWNGIKKIFSGLGTFFLGVVQVISGIFAGLTASIVVIFVKIWENVKKVFSGWGAFFKDLGNKIGTAFKSVGTKVGQVFGGAVKGVINSIINSIEKTINNFIGLINSAIKVINKIPGVSLKQLSYFNIPRLATGGIATSSTLANIGENGAEAVLPLENNTGWMDLLADRIAARNSGPSKIVLSVDGKELGWASIKGINNITEQTGNLQLRIV